MFVDCVRCEYVRIWIERGTADRQTDVCMYVCIHIYVDKQTQVKSSNTHPPRTHVPVVAMSEGVRPIPALVQISQPL